MRFTRAPFVSSCSSGIHQVPVHGRRPRASPSRARSASRIGTWRSDSASRSSPGCETEMYVRENGCRNDHWRSSVAVAGGAHDRGVERRRWPATGRARRRGGGGAHGLQQLGQPQQLVLGDPLGGEPRRERLERRAHRERLEQLLGRERAHRAAAERLVDDAAELLEVAQRLAHRRLRDAELLRDPRLDQPRAGRVLAREDALQDHVLDLLAQVGAGERRLGHWHAVRPPSSVSTWPVMNADASLHSSSTAPTTSSVSAIRPSGMRL